MSAKANGAQRLTKQQRQHRIAGLLEHYSVTSQGQLVDLLTAPTRFWSLGMQLAETLFDAGRRRAQVRLTQAAYDATVANYRQVTLTAFQEVEDNLAALRILEEEARSEAEAVEAARLSLSLVLNQYKAGTVSFLNVVTAQTALLNEERNAVGIQVRRLAAVVALIRALGGGWHEG